MSERDISNVHTPAPMSLRDSELPAIKSAPVAPSTRRGRRIALAILLLLAFLAVAYMAAPLWVGLVLGTVIAFTAQPLYRKLTQWLGDRRTLASVLTTFISGVTTLAGGAAAVYILTRELFVLAEVMRQKMEGSSVGELVPERLTSLLARVGVDRATVIDHMKTEILNASTHAAEAAGIIFSATTSLMLTLIIALFTTYYVLLEWPRIAVRLERLLPLDPRHTRALMLEFRDVGRSAFIGTLATAIVQGTLAGIGFFIAGVPQPVTWGLLTAIGSFLPVIGTAAIWVPVGIFLIMTGRPWWAAFIFVWGSLIVMAMSDYVVRPRLVGKDHGHPLLMLVALLGGISVFGLAGLVVGPVLMSLFLAIMRIYEREVSSDAPFVAPGEGPGTGPPR